MRLRVAKKILALLQYGPHVYKAERRWLAQRRFERWYARHHPVFGAVWRKWAIKRWLWRVRAPYP